MTVSDQKLTQIEDSCERFPSQMIMVREVFQFSFAEAGKISMQFNSNSELVAMLEQLRDFVLECELTDEHKAQLNSLIQDEIDVVTFSQTSRCSVISL